MRTGDAFPIWAKAFSRRFRGVLVLGFATVLLLAAPGAKAGTLYYDNGGPDQRYGILSDFSQSYGQVNGDDFTLTKSMSVTRLEFWGLYYNYSDFTNVPPEPDSFTLRIHEFDGGAPKEAILYEQNVGAPTSRANTGNELNCCPLDIYQYVIEGLSIDLDAGHYLLSIINETVDPAGDGYWHWASSNFDAGSSFWRRENALDFAGQTQVFYDSYFWTEAGVEYAFNLTAVSEPATVAVFGIGLLGLFLVRRRRMAGPGA